MEQSVRLISMTQPCCEEFHSATYESGRMATEDLISYIARVSNPSNQANFDTAQGLLRYCMNNSHWSIFQMVDVTMEIVTTRDIGRQILRHRSFEFQEFSQRYADPTETLGFVTREARLQDSKNRQNSIDTDDKMLQRSWRMKQEQIIHECRLAYKWAIENGIAKEQARSVLPEGNTLSRMYMKGSLRSWIHYCNLRMGHGTQKEHMEIAAKAWDIITEEFSFL